MGYRMKHKKGAFPFKETGVDRVTPSSAKFLGIKKKADAARKQLGNMVGLPGTPIAYNNKFNFQKNSLSEFEDTQENRAIRKSEGTIWKQKNRRIKRRNPNKNKKINFKKSNDYNVDKYGPSAGETIAMDKFNFTKSNDYSKKSLDHKKYSDLEKYDDDK